MDGRIGVYSLLSTTTPSSVVCKKAVNVGINASRVPSGNVRCVAVYGTRTRDTSFAWATQKLYLTKLPLASCLLSTDAGFGSAVKWLAMGMWRSARSPFLQCTFQMGRNSGLIGTVKRNGAVESLWWSMLGVGQGEHRRRHSKEKNGYLMLPQFVQLFPSWLCGNKALHWWTSVKWPDL